ncbi:probable indole-3-pyruvate monooxygenase YUCCA11 [Argentina anserina]|uniref:probable indole-3-pyruvate monooxygenase YUCCA11 n=1 Tax=Argentina anserina TaxID=57926 RepID=UPI0021764A71|nr:probable indole-3-pyruvate monooxygenase YUCCA11 [Potentilla anserina]
MEEIQVVIISAGPAGLATSACLNRLNISNVLLEREDCYASLWNKRSYDRLKLHLAKQFCELPYKPFPENAPTYVPRKYFIQYIDTYVSTFQINPLYHRNVETAFYEEDVGKWCILVNNTKFKFVAVATGENSGGYLPQTKGLSSFKGEIIHSSEYGNGNKYCGKNVLVVGSGNSGMEIAYDLSNSGANTSIVVCSPVHVLTKEIVFLGMVLSKYFPVKIVDGIVLFLTKWKYGNLSKYGIQNPTMGPFYIKQNKGHSPIIDVGTIEKIKSGEIQVLPFIANIEGNEVQFENGYLECYDAIVFATGYKSTVLKWLKDENDLFSENGMPKKPFPKHWKSQKGLYCAGFSSRGLFGISRDAQNIANDINFSLNHSNRDI